MVNIHDDDTAASLSPVPRRRHHALGLALVLLGLVALAAAVAVALSPDLRQLVMGQPQPVAISISSSPEGADTFVDEEHVGSTPTEAQVLPGSHAVRIVRRGYKAWHQLVDTSQSRSVSPTLEPVELATLIVESDPDRSSVFLDDSYRGVTPLTIANVEAGPHTVRVVKEHVYMPVTQQVELAAGDIRRLTFPLKSNIEGFYLTRIKEDPAKLSNYTELLHIYVLDRDAESAVAVVGRTLEALKIGQPDATELRQFYDELQNVYSGKVGALDDATRQKLIDSILILFEKLVEANPSDSSYYSPLATLLGQAGHIDALLKICDKVAAKEEAKGRIHYEIGRDLLSTVGTKAAITFLKRSVELNPAHFYSRYYLGSAYHRADRYDDALREYQEAEKLTKSASSPYYVGLLETGIARVLTSRKDVDGAIAHYKKALALEVPAAYSCQWRLLYAELLGDNGRKDEAIKEYKEILRQEPTYRLTLAARKAIAKLEGKKPPAD